MRTIRTATLTLAALVATAWAGDPPASEELEHKFGVKAGDVLRFRQTESSSTEVDGNPMKASQADQDYSVTVKTLRPGGGLDVAITFERIHTKLTKGGRTMEADSARTPSADSEPQVQVMTTLLRAMAGKPFTVTLDAHGRPVAVSGVRELMKEGLKDTPLAARVDQMFGEDDCMKLALSLFAPGPEGKHAVGVIWDHDVRHEVGGPMLDYTAKSKVSEAAAERLTVTSILTWRPGAEATKDGARAEGMGEETAVFDRKDGFLVSMKRHVEANRSSDKMKATTHADSTIERLPAKEPAPAPEKR
jgi:hypothetical protein